MTYRRIASLPYRMINPVVRYMVLNCDTNTRVEQDALRILRVHGRKTGQLYEIPVRIAVMEGRSYLISMLGHTPWVANLRAAETAQIAAASLDETVRPREVTGDEKIEFLTWYCKHPAYADRARYVFGVAPTLLTRAQVELLAARFPVFCLEPLATAQAA